MADPTNNYTWLQLRSGAPGLGGPFLREKHSPYELLDRLDTQHLQLITAIGDQQKNRFLEKHLSIRATPPKFKDIKLRSLALDHICLVADCELHLCRNLMRVKARPRAGDHTIHEIRGASTSSIDQIAYALYHEVLMPFASLVLLFVSDMGGLTDIVELLAFWVNASMSKPTPSQSTMMLVTNDHIQISEVYWRVSVNLLRSLRLSHPMKPYSRTDAENIIRQYFNIQILHDDQQHTSIFRSLCDSLERSAAARQSLGLGFSAQHMKALLQEAIVQFAKHTSTPFNVYQAARRNNPLPNNMQDHLIEFMLLGNFALEEQSSIIASALTFDAYPPRMHREQVPMPHPSHANA